MNRGEDITTKTVSASEAKSRLGNVLTWVAQNNTSVIITVYGAPKGVLISYQEYQRMLQLRDQARKRTIWEEMESLRKEVSSQGHELSIKERYRLAGMSEQVIQELVAADGVGACVIRKGDRTE